MELPNPDLWFEPPRRQGFSDSAVFPDFGNDIASDGLSADILRGIASAICPDPVEATRLIHTIVPKSSLSRRGKLNLTQSEQTERLSRLFCQAQEAFQDLEDARLFMRRPHPELGGRRPLDAAMTERGGRMVERILDSILYGLPV